MWEERNEWAGVFCFNLTLGLLVICLTRYIYIMLKLQKRSHLWSGHPIFSKQGEDLTLSLTIEWVHLVIKRSETKIKLIFKTEPVILKRRKEEKSKVKKRKGNKFKKKEKH